MLYVRFNIAHVTLDSENNFNESFPEEISCGTVYYTTKWGPNF